MPYRTAARITAILIVGALMASVQPTPAALRSTVRQVPGKTPAQAVRPTVRLRLMVNGQEIAKISTPSGTMATVATDGGEKLGLTPVAAANRITLTVSVRDPATGKFKTVRQLSLERSRPAKVGTDRTALEVEWLQTSEVTAPAPRVAAPTSQCSECCVSCDGRSICACEVSTSCGYCCCRSQCECGWANQ